MTHANGPLLRLTAKERQIVEMAIHGMSVEQMSITLGQSPKVVIRHMHQCIRKLEMWSFNTVPASSAHSLSEQELGILKPWEAERRITRLIREIGNAWACVVVLAMPDEAPGPNGATVIEAISCHVQASVRQSDIITKWIATEWILFLPYISPDHMDMVVRRLERKHIPSWSLFVLACSSTGAESFRQLAARGHDELMRQYIHRNLGSWGIP